MLSDSVGPVRPRRLYNSDHSSLVLQIEKMYQNYHNSNLTYLEDEILFHEGSQFLKRQYQEYQFSNKIMMLSEYYQYHKELPRIFQKEIYNIIQIYHEDVRNLEYELVTRKMSRNSSEGDIFTERERMKPADKIIKNIELSYYNFEKKDIKRVKDEKPKHITSNKNKKSMPILPLHQHYPKNTHHPPKPHPKPVSIITSIQPLKLKDLNKLAKSKQNLKKISLNNSIDSHKNLSRSKSKSNLVSAHLDPKRHSVKPFLQVPISSKNQKARSNPTSLQKASSHKNFLKKQQPNKRLLMQKLQDMRQKNGVKNMFKKVMQTKKVIKIAR